MQGHGHDGNKQDPGAVVHSDHGDVYTSSPSVTDCDFDLSRSSAVIIIEYVLSRGLATT